MPKEFFCSECGLRLVNFIKALPNQTKIVQVIEPHVCDREFRYNITDADKPESAFAKEQADKEANPEIPDNKDRGFPSLEFSDKRPKDNQKSTAPQGVLNQIDHGSNSTPEHDLEK